MIVANGRAIDPRQGLDARLDLRLREGRIVELGEHLTPDPGEDVLDASGACVAPGFIDMHVHLREPGQSEKETLETGTAAAVLGGFTAVACMPNTQPALDEPALLRELARQAERWALCRVYPIAALTRRRAGEQLVDYAALAQAGAVAFSDDGATVSNARVLRDAAAAARGIAGCFISHCEDEHLKGTGVMHEGAVSHELGLPGSPAIAEESIVLRDALVGMDTGKDWHLAHLSTSGSIDAVRWLRSRGAHLTCEVTPHHLLLCDEEIRAQGATAKVNPPLRTQQDAAALREAVRDGTIDAFATDHAPHTQREKSGDIRRAAVGFTGLEIAVGAYAAAVPDLPLARFVELLSCNPARILGVPGGTLAIGSPADLTLFAEREWRVDPTRFASKGKSTPFAGRRFSRQAVATIVGGRLRAWDGIIRQ